MTSTVNELTRSFLASTSERESIVVDVVAIALLFVLLLEWELLRAYLGQARRLRLDVLAGTVVPLLAAFAVIVTVRATGLR
jgi:hypothetical protein